jgi:chromosome partitioning protein
MSNRIATINLKGGVGKTTTTCALAELLAVEHEQRVLVVDLDPQTNLTTMLIGEDQWKEQNEAGQTLAQLFKDAFLEDVDQHVFDLEEALLQGVGAVAEVRKTSRLDLLPSSLDLIDVQDRISQISAGRFYARSPGEILNTALKQVLDDYDWVIIDCPPNLGLITLNGLRISQGYVIPTIPDVLSTYGIPQIVSRVAGFSREINEPIEPYGIIINKFREISLHRTTVENLREDEDLPIVFDTIIKEHAQIAQAAEHAEMGTLRQKWGYGEGFYDAYSDLTSEIVEVVEGATVR